MSGRQILVLLLPSGTGAQRVGVTDTLRADRALPELPSTGDPRRVFGLVLVSPSPFGDTTDRAGSSSQGGSRGCGSLQGLQRGMGHVGSARGIPDFPVGGVGMARFPCGQSWRGCGGRMCQPPILLRKNINCRAAALASASLPGAESKLQSPV